MYCSQSIIQLFICVVVLLGGTILQVAQAQVNEFVNPPPQGTAGVFTGNYVYSVGTELTLRWNTEWERTSLVLYQDRNNSFVYLPGSEGITSLSFPWTVETEGLFDLRQGNVFFFTVYKYGSGNELFHSHYMNFTDDTVDAQGNIRATTTSNSITSLPTTPTETSSTASSTATNDSGTSTNSSLQLGLGVGVGVGVALVVGVVAILMFRRRRRTKALQQPGDAIDPVSKQSPYLHGYSEHLHDVQPPPELPPNQRHPPNRHEMQA